MSSRASLRLVWRDRAEGVTLMRAVKAGDTHRTSRRRPKGLCRASREADREQEQGRTAAGGGRERATPREPRAILDAWCTPDGGGAYSGLVFARIADHADQRLRLGSACGLSERTRGGHERTERGGRRGWLAGRASGGSTAGRIEGWAPGRRRTTKALLGWTGRLRRSGGLAACGCVGGAARGDCLRFVYGALLLLRPRQG